MNIINEDTKLQSILDNQREHWSNVVIELMDGEKKTHWCWYFLPNIPGLGTSEESQYFAVTPLEFARYMKNSEYRGNVFTVVYLIDRAYRESCDMDLERILGKVDKLKFVSFLTLLSHYLYQENPYDVPESIEDIMITYKKVYGSCPYTLDFCQSINE